MIRAPAAAWKSSIALNVMFLAVWLAIVVFTTAHHEYWRDEVRVLARGEPHPDYREEQGAAVLARPEYSIGIDLGRGRARARIWTCDLSHDYVRINAEYRT